MTINKTFVEKRIEKIADERLKVEYNNFIEFITKNPIFKGLKVKVGDNYYNFVKQYSNDEMYIFNNSIDGENSDTIKKCLENRKDILIKEETDNILNKLNSLEYLFNQ